MGPTGVMGIIYQIADRIMKLAYINILWLIFTIVGLVIFGLFPATIAMFAVLRKMVLKEDINIFRLYWKTYKQEFVKGNLVGLVLLLAGFITYINFVFFGEPSGVTELLFYPIVFVTFLLMLVTFFVFPVYVHFDESFKNVFKIAFVFSLLYPLSSLAMVVNCSLLIIVFIAFPPSVLFFGGSLTGFVIMMAANRAFRKNTYKLEKSQT